MPGAKWITRRVGTFQSAPGREAGRCGRVRLVEIRAESFNPRPAVRPGDAASRVALLA